MNVCRCKSYCQPGRMCIFSYEFLSVYIYMLLSFILTVVLFGIGLVLSPYVTDFEKLSAYECGFIPVGDTRQPFHVRFYLVGVLFLLFDLEVIFLFPCVLYIHSFIKF